LRQPTRQLDARPETPTFTADLPDAQIAYRRRYRRRDTPFQLVDNMHLRRFAPLPPLDTADDMLLFFAVFRSAFRLMLIFVAAASVDMLRREDCEPSTL